MMSGTLDPKLWARCQFRARIVKAIAHPVRLLILEELLRSGSRCVCEIAELVGLDMSTASRHLAQMKEAGILTDERKGAMTFYRIRTACVLQFLECIDRVAQEGLERQLDLLR
jgi:DNA-binding transcriptional ArsR family regulator